MSTGDRTVRIRLVPKSSTREPFSVNLRELSPARARRLQPAPETVDELSQRAVSMNMKPVFQSRSALEVSAADDQFESIFQTKLTVAKSPASETGFFESGREEYVVPEGELKVPESLQDFVEFAYVPVPPRFFAPTPIPPGSSNFHLRIEDVQRVLGGARCHRRGWTGDGVRVAMADTGFAPHPYFSAHDYQIHRVHTPSTSHPAIDDSGHGTGESANVLTMAPDCTFFGVKHDDYSAEALETMLDQDPKVLTNSWGWNIDTVSMDQLRLQNPNTYNELRDLERILLAAIDEGRIVIFAGGNGHRAFPACMPDVIAVGGVSVDIQGGLRASDYASSFRSLLYAGRAVPDICGIVGRGGNGSLEGHIMLPVPSGSDLEGQNISKAADRNKGWGIFSGTSAAAPQVAGTVALMLSVNPGLTQSDVRSILSDTAIDVVEGLSAHGDAADLGYDLATGPGLVDALAACERALAMT